MASMATLTGPTVATAYLSLCSSPDEMVIYPLSVAPKSAFAVVTRLCTGVVNIALLCGNTCRTDICASCVTLYSIHAYSFQMLS